MNNPTSSSRPGVRESNRRTHVGATKGVMTANETTGDTGPRDVQVPQSLVFRTLGLSSITRGFAVGTPSLTRFPAPGSDEICVNIEAKQRACNVGYICLQIIPR